MAHDSLCQWSGPDAYNLPCQCDLIARARADELDRWLKSDHLDRVLEQARADERERNREAEGVELYLANEHAEAVAARLVEVIVDDDFNLRRLQEGHDFFRDAALRIVGERDAEAFAQP